MTAAKGICGNQKAFWKTQCTKCLTQLSLTLPGPVFPSCTRSSLLCWLMLRQCGTGSEREQGSCKPKSPWGGLQLDKVFNNKIPETADWRKAQYFSLSTNLLQSYTTPMQQHPQLHAVNNKQIYFHQPC